MFEGHIDLPTGAGVEDLDLQPHGSGSDVHISQRSLRPRATTRNNRPAVGRQPFGAPSSCAAQAGVCPEMIISVMGVTVGTWDAC